jgi:curved DNA-binding protein CbpA
MLPREIFIVLCYCSSGPNRFYSLGHSQETPGDFNCVTFMSSLTVTRRASTLTNEILVKLSASIDKNLSSLGANPVAALQLSRGFKSSDVKKSYRALALKYHPDKKKDSATSCIFAVIQSAYEKLKSSNLALGHNGINGANDGTASRHSSYRFEAEHNPKSTSKPEHPSKADRYEASIFSQLSTGELKEKMKKFLGAESSVDDMNRESLLRRCLALSSHAQTQHKRRRAGLAFDSDFCKAFQKVFEPNGSKRDASAEPNPSSNIPRDRREQQTKSSQDDVSNKWTQDLRKEMDRDSARQKTQVRILCILWVKLT